MVVGLPRGGVPVGYEVARALGAPLDVIVVRKLGVPFRPELGMGAVGEDGLRVINRRVLEAAGVTLDELALVEQRERVEVERRARRFRGDRPRVPLSGRTVVIVDDGLATGSTARAAARVARAEGASRVVLAVPVGAAESVRSLSADADEVVALRTPDAFFGVGEWYADFTQTPDDEVVALLAAAASRGLSVTASTRREPPGDAALAPRDDEIQIAIDGFRLGGHLTVPEAGSGIVVFAHGSGSSRHSSRNRSVARALHHAGLGTLLFDLLTDDEASDRANVFEVQLLAQRLQIATTWLRTQPECDGVPTGYFGASTGAAAALWAAADPAGEIGAVVSRGGRPDLAGPRLGAVRAPTLLVVGGADSTVIGLNRQAAKQLRCEHRLEVVPGATHLFEEPGALERVSALAADWFCDHLGAASAAGPTSRPRAPDPTPTTSTRS